MPHDMISIFGSRPDGVSLNIRHDHLSLLEGRDATRRYVLAHGPPGDRIDVAWGKRWGYTVLECRAAPVDRIDAAKAVWRNILYELAQRFEDVAKRPAGGNHIEKLILARELCVRPLAVFNVD